jgi:hypothetical protein
MLPAQKEEAVPANLTAPQTAGFGKVLNSIQGLQQRLDDFSVEDVSHAQAKADNLIRELSLLQLKLTGLAIMGQTLTDARRTISAIPNEDFDLANADSLEKYPTLHALAASDKLVQLIRARAHVFAIYIDQLNAARESTEAITVNSDQQAPKALPSPVLQLEASPVAEVNATVVRSMALTETDAELPLAAPVETPQIAERADLLPPSPTANHWQTRNAAAKTSDQGANTATLAEHPQDETRGKKTMPAADSNFNQRLLDDLIHNYGDFAGSPNLSAPRKARKSATQKASEHEIATVHVALTTATIASIPHDVAPVDVPAPEEVSAEIRQIEIPSLEAQPPKPTEKNGTGLTKQGEIDRQLKSIIKDYGEYDLYQRHSPLNLRVAGILAFALLALVLGGFYFLKSPAPGTSAPANSAVQSGVGSSSVPPGSSSTANSTPGRTSGHEVTGTAGTGERPSSAVTNTKQKK